VIAGEDLEVMSVVKSLWAMVQGDPVFMRRINGWLAIFWVAMIPISLVMHWVSSVIYVSALSLWALVSGHWSAWQAARVGSRSGPARRGTLAIRSTTKGTGSGPSPDLTSAEPRLLNHPRTRRAASHR
jgi:hypothetical protein